MLLNQEKRINLLYILGILGIGLILASPAIFHDVFRGMDLLQYHLKWSKHFSEQFWAGELYPRWLMEMNAGLGSPAFFFYAPVPYYFSSLFHPLFPNDLYGWHQLSLSAALALAASGFTAYIWLRDITNSKSAFIASILYMSLPYHLSVDLYQRFSLAEYWTFVWIPLILYFGRRLVRGHKFSILGFAVSYALLIMTHLITVLMFSIVPVGYVLFMADKRERKIALVRTVIAMILGIGLSGIYLFPAMTTQGAVSINAIQEGFFSYKNNFLFSGPLVDAAHFKKFWVYLGFITLHMAVLAGCAFGIVRAGLKLSLRKESVFWIVVAAVAFFMTIPLSTPVWKVLPILQRVQFPWRFDTILTVATTALLALEVSTLRKPFNLLTKRLLAVQLLILTSLLLSSIVVIHAPLRDPISSVDIGREMDVSMDDWAYRPKWVSPQLFESTSTVRELGKSFAKVQVAEGKGSASIQQWNSRKIVLETNATTDVWLVVHQFYYPGWNARLDEAHHNLLPVQPLKPEGLLRVWVPNGSHEVMLTLDVGVQEQLGQIISAVSVTMLFLCFWFYETERGNMGGDLDVTKCNKSA